MPVLKVRAKDVNELAASSAFLFAQRPLSMEDKAQALLTDDARKLRLLAAASHDLRQPLHAMGLFAEALRQRPELADVDNNLSNQGRALELTIDRDKASVLGVPMQTIDDTLYDARLRWLAPQQADPQVVVIDIDERALADHGRWPWPRYA